MKERIHSAGNRSRIAVYGRAGALLLGVAAACSGAPGGKPVETGVYRTGAWFSPRTDQERRLYLAGGFTMVPYSRDPKNIEWAARHGLVYINTVSNWGMPPGLGDLFEAADGSRSASVGLFTSVNFNSPDVAAWWRKRVPELVRSMPDAARTAFWKVHNEFGYHSGKVYDYSPGSLSRYRQWLKQRYGTIGELNRRWGTAWKRFEDIRPPRTRKEMRADLPGWLEWRRFTCWNFADYFRSTGDLIRGVLPGARVSDNFYTTSPLQGWDNFELARQTDYLAYDIYAIGRWSHLIDLLEHARTAAAAWNKPFILMEYHAGPNHWARIVRREDLLIEASLALGRECRALQWFRWIPGSGGREQGIHGMMDSHGRPTERFTAAAEVSAFAQRLAPLLEKARTTAGAAIVTSSDSAYLAYAFGRNVWRARQQWDALRRMLDLARVQTDQIDPVWIEAHPDRLHRYRTLILAGLPVLSRRTEHILLSWVEAGGALVVHPEVARRDGLGRPRTSRSILDAFDSDADGAKPAPSRAGGMRNVRGSSRPVVVRRRGKGRIVFCGLEPPAGGRMSDSFVRLAGRYAAILREKAGVRPDLDIEAPVRAERIDARRLRAGNATLIVLTALTHEPVRNVIVTVPRLTCRTPPVLLVPQSAAARPLQATRVEDGLRFEVPELAPAATVLLADAWQPVLSLEAPKRLFPGVEFDANVRLVGCGGEAAAARVRLEAPEGWTVRPPTAGDGVPVISVKPGTVSAPVRFRVRIPRDAAVDRFGIAYPLRATARFIAGRSGSLTVRHLPFVLPVVDLQVTYHGELVTPWQELTPPVMRWGWNNEVHTPPPPPVAIRTAAPVELKVTAAPGFAGRRLHLALRGPAAGARLEPDAVTLPASRSTGGLEPVEARVRLRVILPEPGEWTLAARSGDATVAEVTFTAGVNTETVETALDSAEMPALPAGMTPVALLGVGVREADGLGRAAEFSLPSGLPARDLLRVVDRRGRLCPAAFSGNHVALPVDAARDRIDVFTVAALRAGEAAGRSVPRRVRFRRLDRNAVTVSGDAYTVCFDENLGLVRWLDVDGHRVVRWRTGVTALDREGREWGPDGAAAASAFGASSSAVSARVTFSRPIGPPEHPLTVEEEWQLDPGHIGVRVRITNRTRGPLSFARLDYELGIDPAAAPRWTLTPPASTGAEARVRRGRLPSGFSVGGAGLVDWLTADGPAGIGLTLRRCALATKWRSGFAGVQHTAARTAVLLLRNVLLDPGDLVMAEFDLWPHRGAVGNVGDPVFVTVSRSVTPPRQ